MEVAINSLLLRAAIFDLDESCCGRGVVCYIHVQLKNKKKIKKLFFTTLATTSIHRHTSFTLCVRGGQLLKSFSFIFLSVHLFLLNCTHTTTDSSSFSPQTHTSNHQRHTTRHTQHNTHTLSLSQPVPLSKL